MDVTKRRETMKDLLHSERFLRRAVGMSDFELCELVIEMCHECQLEAGIVSVETSGAGGASYRLVWQSVAGGPFEDQWFSIP